MIDCWSSNAARSAAVSVPPGSGAVQEGLLLGGGAAAAVARINVPSRWAAEQTRQRPAPVLGRGLAQHGRALAAGVHRAGNQGLGRFASNPITPRRQCSSSFSAGRGSFRGAWSSGRPGPKAAV